MGRIWSTKVTENRNYLMKKEISMSHVFFRPKHFSLIKTEVSYCYKTSVFKTDSSQIALRPLISKKLEKNKH